MYNDTINVNYKNKHAHRNMFQKDKMIKLTSSESKRQYKRISLLSFLKQTLHDGLRDNDRYPLGFSILG